MVQKEHSMQYDLIIRHAHLHRRDGLVDIAVKGGQFARIANELSSDSAIHEIDVAGGSFYRHLFTPMFTWMPYLPLGSHATIHPEHSLREFKTGVKANRV